jgi:DegV family protein with EDD domain
MTVKIVTDSTADLTKEEIEKYNIHVLPLRIELEGKAYTDRVNITPSEFIKKMKLSETLPKTSQPPIGDFVKKYRELVQDGSEVLSIHLSSALSGTVQTAHIAAEQCEGRITVIDSKFISKALAFQVVEAAKMASVGHAIEEIIDRIEHIRLQTKLYIIVDTLENLVKGGRIGKGKAMIGSLLNIKPIASLQNGAYQPLKKSRSFPLAIKQLMKYVKEDIKGKKLKAINLVHADGKHSAEIMKMKLYEFVGNLDIQISDTTPIISTHTGPGAVALMFYTD